VCVLMEDDFKSEGDRSITCTPQSQIKRTWSQVPSARAVAPRVSDYWVSILQSELLCPSSPNKPYTRSMFSSPGSTVGTSTVHARSPPAAKKSRSELYLPRRAADTCAPPNQYARATARARELVAKTQAQAALEECGPSSSTSERSPLIARGSSGSPAISKKKVVLNQNHIRQEVSRLRTQEKAVPVSA
jgi:hypothetical protein